MFLVFFFVLFRTGHFRAIGPTLKQSSCKSGTRRLIIDSLSFRGKQLTLYSCLRSHTTHHSHAYLYSSLYYVHLVAPRGGPDATCFAEAQHRMHNAESASIASDRTSENVENGNTGGEAKSNDSPYTCRQLRLGVVERL